MESSSLLVVRKPFIKDDEIFLNVFKTPLIIKFGQFLNFKTVQSDILGLSLSKNENNYPVWVFLEKKSIPYLFDIRFAVILPDS